MRLRLKETAEGAAWVLPMLQSLTVAVALPGKQFHTKEEPGSLRGLALQTIEAFAPLTIVADCTAQL